MKSFDGEKALLDKDELFLAEVPEASTDTPVAQPLVYETLPMLAPLPSRYQWIFETHFLPNLFPGQDILPGVIDCLTSTAEDAMKKIALVIATGGAAALVTPILIASVLRKFIFTCAGNFADAAIYEGGLSQMIIDCSQIIPGGLYYDSYDQAAFTRGSTRANVEFKNSFLRLQQTVAWINRTNKLQAASILKGSNVEVDDASYNLDNLSNNYRVARVEYLDQILPFDIVIVAVNEYGQSAQMRIYGCEISSINSELSIDQMTLPYSLNFTARTILPWRSFSLNVPGGISIGNSSTGQSVQPSTSVSVLTPGRSRLNILDELSEDEVNDD
jgi:hypothetical protein